MNNYIIKRAIVEDVDFIFEIDSDYPCDKYSKDTIRNMLSEESNINLIIMCNDNPIGYISSSVVLDEATLIKIVVKDRFKRMQYGEKLLKELIEELYKINVNNVFLEVRSGNIPAKKLYEKFGFYTIHKRLKYYNDGEDADIYRLSLNV